MSSVLEKQERDCSPAKAALKRRFSFDRIKCSAYPLLGKLHKLFLNFKSGV